MSAQDRSWMSAPAGPSSRWSPPQPQPVQTKFDWRPVVVFLFILGACFRYPWSIPVVVVLVLWVGWHYRPRPKATTRVIVTQGDHVLYDGPSPVPPGVVRAGEDVQITANGPYEVRTR